MFYGIVLNCDAHYIINSCINDMEYFTREKDMDSNQIRLSLSSRPYVCVLLNVMLCNPINKREYQQL